MGVLYKQKCLYTEKVFRRYLLHKQASIVQKSSIKSTSYILTMIHFIKIKFIRFSKRSSLVAQWQCQTGDASSIPGSRRPPGEGNGNLLQYSCLESPIDRGVWQSPWSPRDHTRVRHDLATKWWQQFLIETSVKNKSHLILKLLSKSIVKDYTRWHILTWSRNLDHMFEKTDVM